ncbi:hypothetical protein ASG40_13120 [Methylobacterium sp. Leaf399]|uniref:hypothetical protein n=1 Tax=unclassified Methylobacterium TaxID=2615210 RepID=UPI0006F4E54A|nr:MULTISPECIES: hypothetical protein [unclassified Methylobacterium]KQP50860.1 hypothetical protein ASF39_11500 [Methylobacterium sp. Leaf108]KQT07842.1 hypothetical protein ASG40_13120 [Methylobacterium sp. Leaf399]KQT88957.1 hypothetical protein ASG59_13895 [Methylobacterium sp. Leaf466]
MTETSTNDRPARSGTGPSLSLVEPATVPSDRRGAVRRKLVIEVSSDLHQRILSICATRRIPVNQAVREVLERSFPGK